MTGGPGDEGGGPSPTSPTGASPVGERSLVLRLGLPRDVLGPQHLAGFVVTAVLTVLATRGLLAATGYPQLGGGGGLHVAHVLWGGLLLAVAVVGLLTYAGPAVRPAAAIVAGVGFGLFVDEIGKFVTSDNNYFYEPAAALIYVVVVLLVLLGEVLHGRGDRARDPNELLAAAVDQAVAGLAGGFSVRARHRARELVDAAGDVHGSREVRALLDLVEDDARELPDVIGAVSGYVVRSTRRLVRARWVPWITVAVLSLTGAATVGAGLAAWAAGSGIPAWVVAGMLLSGLGSLVCSIIGLVRVGRSREDGYVWFRRAVLVSLLLTQIFLFRLVQWAATAGLAIDLVLLGLIAAELDVIRSRSREASMVPVEAHTT
ncbi:MAG: hypothetical protein ACOH17_14570 [Cellulomonas sp.]